MRRSANATFGSSAFSVTASGISLARQLARRERIEPGDARRAHAGDDDLRVECAEPEARGFGSERRIAERAANQRFLRDAFDIGKRADLQAVPVALNFAKIGHVGDVDDHAVAFAGILEAEKTARAGAPADASAMNEREAQGFAQMTRPSNLRCFHCRQCSTRGMH